MKKLLMMAVVACMATFAQALTINWQAPWGSLDTLDGVTSVTLVYSTETDIAKIATSINNGTLSSVATIDTMEGFTDYIDATASADTYSTTGNYFFVISKDKDFYISSAAATDATWYGVPGDPTATLGTAFTTVTVPEPTALALLALGVAGVALRRRRRA